MSDTMIYINQEEGLARVRGNAGLYKRMLGLFMSSTEFAAFEEAVAAEDWGRAAEVAHAIKGMTGNLSLTALFEISNKLMTNLRQGAPAPGELEHYRQVLSETQTQVSHLIETL